MMLALPSFSAGELSQFFSECKAMDGAFQEKWVEKMETHPQTQETLNFYSYLIYCIFSAKIMS